MWTRMTAACEPASRCSPVRESSCTSSASPSPPLTGSCPSLRTGFHHLRLPLCRRPVDFLNGPDDRRFDYALAKRTLLSYRSGPPLARPWQASFRLHHALGIL